MALLITAAYQVDHCLQRAFVVWAADHVQVVAFGTEVLVLTIATSDMGNQNEEPKYHDVSILPEDVWS